MLFDKLNSVLISAKTPEEAVQKFLEMTGIDGSKFAVDVSEVEKQEMEGTPATPEPQETDACSSSVSTDDHWLRQRALELAVRPDDWNAEDTIRRAKVYYDFLTGKN